MSSIVEGVAEGVKQKNMAGPGGRNRRALGDIGNLVTARAVVEGSPVTRLSFFSSLCSFTKYVGFLLYCFPKNLDF